ncbi:MAG: UPF0175 family protein [Verrucomicrobiales bacterium]
MVYRMNISVDIPDEVVSEWEDGAEDLAATLQRELALHLYASRRLSAGLATKVSGLSRGEFETAIRESGIVRNYNRADLEHDLAFSFD